MITVASRIGVREQTRERAYCKMNFIRVFISIAVNKAKVIKRQSVFDRLGNESPPLEVTPKEPEKKTQVKTLKPLKTSVTVQLKVRTASFWVTLVTPPFFAFEE